MKAYHFLRKDMRSGKGDEPPWRKGETRTWEGECVLCESGYYSSPTWLDALKYALGPIACIVDVSEPIKKDDDRQVSKERTLVDYRDTTKPLVLFACECAERALKRVPIPEWHAERAWQLLEVRRLWLENKVTDNIMKAAQKDAMGISTFCVTPSDAFAWKALEAATLPTPRGSRDEPELRARYAAMYSALQAARYNSEIRWQHRRLNQLMRRLFNEVGD